MQELTVDLRKQIEEAQGLREAQEVQKHNYPVPEGAKGVAFRVVADFRDGAVMVSVDGRNFRLTLDGAWDLAQALRDAAYKIKTADKRKYRHEKRGK